MKIKLDEGAFLPNRAHPTDAGLDLFAPKGMYVESHCSAVVDTGVHIELPKGTFGLITSKSGLFFCDEIFTTGTIDEPYRGSIKVKLMNHSGEPKQFERGDKIAQLVIIPIITPTLEVVEELSETDRGNGGFGSTGK